MIKRLAVVKSVKLTMYNRCVLGVSIWAEYEDGLSQDVCGLTIDSYNKDLEEREGTKEGCELIRQLLLFFGVSDFSEVKNYYCYVITDEQSLTRKVYGIENISVSLNSEKKKSIIYSDVFKG